jgi:hypothetical protein
MTGNNTERYHVLFSNTDHHFAAATDSQSAKVAGLHIKVGLQVCLPNVVLYHCTRRSGHITNCLTPQSVPWMALNTSRPRFTYIMDLKSRNKAAVYRVPINIFFWPTEVCDASQKEIWHNIPTYSSKTYIAVGVQRQQKWNKEEILTGRKGIHFHAGESFGPWKFVLHYKNHVNE